MIFGNLHAQKLRKTREEADKVALANAITRAEYINRVELEELHASIAAGIRTIVRSSPLPRETQDEVLRSISGLKVRVAGIAAAQRRGMNGEASGHGNGAGSKRTHRKPGRKPKQKEAEAEQPAAVQEDG